MKCVNCQQVVKSCICVAVDMFFAKAQGVARAKDTKAATKIKVGLAGELSGLNSSRAKHLRYCPACKYGLDCMTLKNYDRDIDKTIANAKNELKRNVA